MTDYSNKDYLNFDTDDLTDTDQPNTTHRDRDEGHRHAGIAKSSSPSVILVLATAIILVANLAAVAGLTLALACL